MMIPVIGKSGRAIARANKRLVIGDVPQELQERVADCMDIIAPGVWDELPPEVNGRMILMLGIEFVAAIRAAVAFLDDSAAGAKLKEAKK